MWAVFAAIVIFLLALDLGVFRRGSHEVTVKEAATWTAVWVGVSLCFNGFVWWKMGPEAAMQYLAGYLLEQSLSVDNLFVFVAVFGAFAVPAALLHRVLFWGIIGAVLLRAIFVGGGTALVTRFDWLLYILGALLVYTGIKLLKEDEGEEKPHPRNHPMVKALQRLFPMTDEYVGDSFFARIDGRWHLTPLFAVLLVIEASDVVFAIDSVPAVFGITTDPFIVYTSNIFAILGLRSMFFLLQGIIHKFWALRFALAAILSFVGVKMLIVKWYHVPIPISLGFIALSLTLAVVWSLKNPRAEKEEH